MELQNRGNVMVHVYVYTRALPLTRGSSQWGSIAVPVGNTLKMSGKGPTILPPFPPQYMTTDGIAHEAKY